MNLDKILELEVGKPKIPTVWDKIYNKTLIFQVSTGEMWVIVNDFGSVQLSIYNSMKDLEFMRGNIDEFTIITDKLLGKALKEYEPKIVKVWICHN